MPIATHFYLCAFANSIVTGRDDSNQTTQTHSSLLLNTNTY